MNKKFIVRLSVEERSQLEALVAKGKAAARKLTRARILLISSEFEIRILTTIYIDDIL
jgi:hypothetical protein